MSSTGATGTSGTSTATTTAAAATTEATAATSLTDLATSDVYGIFVGIFLLVLTLIVLFTTGSIISVLVLWATIALMVVVLVYYGFVDIAKLFPKKTPSTTPPGSARPPAGSPLVGSEVFHVQQNQFTYDEAAAVCAAYDSELATLEQVMEAYNHGAEWCGYGWSAGGLALYPTQKSTWEQLQREVDMSKRTRCGRPGVNGGYMDPMLKLGVNCFGFKPKGDFKPPSPLPGTDPDQFDAMVNRFREMLNTLKMSPFSRREWSGYDSSAGGIIRSNLERFWGGAPGSTVEMPRFSQSFATPQGCVEGFAIEENFVVERMETSSYSAGPYGLRGDVGSTGPTGAASTVAGPAGSPGTPGAPGTPGTRGPTGPRGAVGAASTVAGPAGAVGAVGARGPTGAQGIPGTAAAAGAPGPQGLVGPAGAAGAPGAVGPQGVAGPTGPLGTVPKDLIVDTLKIGGWSFSPVGDSLRVGRTEAGGKPINLYSTPENSFLYSDRLQGKLV